MHEWALAEAVISTVQRLYEENGRKKVLSVEVLIGELQHIEMAVFSMGLQNLLAEHPFGLDVFHFETEKASFRCNACGNEWLLEQHADLGEEEREAIHFLPEAAHVYMRCPSCGSPDFKLEKGRGVSIKSVDLQDDPEDPR
jgi:hydrogenase nickel incorporation protein HypA/HybF